MFYRFCYPEKTDFFLCHFDDTGGELKISVAKSLFSGADFSPSCLRFEMTAFLKHLINLKF